MADQTLVPPAADRNPPTEILTSGLARRIDSYAESTEARPGAAVASPATAGRTVQIGRIPMSRRQMLSAGALPAAVALGQINATAEAPVDPALTLWEQWSAAARVAFDAADRAEKMLYALPIEVRAASRNQAEIAAAEAVADDLHKAWVALEKELDGLDGGGPIAVAAQLHAVLDRMGSAEERDWKAVANALRLFAPSLPAEMRAKIEADIGEQATNAVRFAEHEAARAKV